MCICQTNAINTHRHIRSSGVYHLAPAIKKWAEVKTVTDKITVRFTEEEIEQLKAYANLTHQNLSSFIRQCVQEKLNRISRVQDDFIKSIPDIRELINELYILKNNEQRAGNLLKLFGESEKEENIKAIRKVASDIDLFIQNLNRLFGV